MEGEKLESENSTTTTVAKMSAIRFNIDQKCPIQYVTVYNDRAEATRLLQYHFDVEGTYDLILEGFSSCVDETSFHVSGGTGKACTILEVSYQVCYDNPTEETDLTLVDQLKVELEKVEDEMNVRTREIERIKKQRAWLDGRAMKLMNQDGQVNTTDLENMNQFLEFYHKSLVKLDERTVTEANDLKKLTNQQIALQLKINKHGAGNRQANRKERREITISVHIGSSNLGVDLEVSYLISNCSWSASYDVRVNSQTISKQQTQLTYYGIIVNQSQENWPDTQFSLSTATPSLGGSPPKLNTLKINYYQPPPPRRPDLNYVPYSVSPCSDGFDEAELHGGIKMNSKKKTNMSLRQRTTLSSESIVEDSYINSDDTVNVLSTTTQASMSSSSFNIPRRCTIESDGKPHKVTIGVLDLTSTFIYTIIPKLSLHAYLKASTINTSDKQLLSGPASIFMDNNFVTNGSIDNVSLGDKFDLPLGTDASIKVEYKPIKKVSDTQGLISKTHFETVRRETHLTNTKSTEITVYVYEQVPLSSHEKIKVKLITPDLKPKHSNAGCAVTINENNHIEWKCILQPKEQARLPLEYSLEWPNEKRIEFSEQ